MIFGVDPGTTQTAVVGISKSGGTVLRLLDSNPYVLSQLQVVVKDGDVVAIEMVACYGMPVGRTTFETVLWIGRFIQAIDPHPVRLITRNEVKMALCHTIKGVNDAVIRQRLVDMYGGTKQVALGTKKQPGPLYGIKTHLWSALAVAVTAKETMPAPGERQ